MSLNSAKTCNIENIIDERFAGIAKGVGFQKIIGRVHYVQMEIEDKFLSASFEILENQDIDILIGLDFLKRHRASIDLKENCLKFNDIDMKTKFLSENELPSQGIGNSTESKSKPMRDESFDENVDKLVKMGFDKDKCCNILEQTGGDFNLAITILSTE